jgi:hypothetical protein
LNKKDLFDIEKIGGNLQTVALEITSLSYSESGLKKLNGTERY